VSETFNATLSAINAVLWHEYVLYIILLTGVAFTLWSRFSQVTALTHGLDVVRGKFDSKNHPGAISHFQALSAALSATVGLGNIGGVAVAVALGGPGAIFWMWIVGFVGMAIKTTEVSLSMIYRNTDVKDEPHGGPMWVVDKGLKAWNPKLAPLGKLIGCIFCVTLIISAITGGNMFQAWNVAQLSEHNFQIPQLFTGVLLAALVGLVIIGGIKRIGGVAGRLVPFMCGMYLIAALAVLAVNITEIPSMLWLIVQSAFSPVSAQGSFVGGTVGYAFLWGMKRALFSNEAGQGSAPIAHSAARTDEPIREGIVAGLEPFIDTIFVCTITALVILSSGAWNRQVNAEFINEANVIQTSSGQWSLDIADLPDGTDSWQEGQSVFVLLKGEQTNAQTGDRIFKLFGKTTVTDSGFGVQWKPLDLDQQPVLESNGVFIDYPGASLTSHAFDRVFPGLGKWLVTFAAWLFAISTMISWSYYGEQGIIYMFGRGVMLYRIGYCALIMVATSGLITTDADLDNFTALGTGVMLFANIPICWIFAAQAMKGLKQYRLDLKAGKFEEHAPKTFSQIVEDK
jgi:alanine or glycine:cation symporter, AGCS family